MGGNNVMMMRNADPDTDSDSDTGAVVGTATAMAEEEVSSLGEMIYFTPEEMSLLNDLSYFDETSSPPCQHHFEVKVTCHCLLDTSWILLSPRLPMTTALY
eukprot:1194046-Prorocentrum_minimum.AAC.2